MKASVAFYKHQTATANAICNLSASILMHQPAYLMANVNSGHQGKVSFYTMTKATAIATKRK